MLRWRRPDRSEVRWQNGRRVPTIEELKARERTTYLAGQLQSAPDDLEAARERADSTPTLFCASSGLTSGARGSNFVDEYPATGGTDSSR